MIPIPLRDDAPCYRRPIVVPLLLVSQIAIYVLQVTVFREHHDVLIDALAVQGKRMLDVWRAFLADPHSVKLSEFVINGVTSPITYMFLHAGPMHLLGNLLFLWVYGDNIEGRMGHGRFIAFYLLAGMAAAVVHAFMHPNNIPVVGSSGAIAGVLGAYLLLFPGSHVTVLLFLFVFVTIVRIPAWALLLFWFAVQLPAVQGLFNFLSVEGVAYWAHIGGFLAGMVLLPFAIWRNPAP